jgi:hypothetical protein
MINLAEKWYTVTAALCLLVSGVIHAQDQATTTGAMREDVTTLSPYSPNGAIMKRSPDKSCNGFQPFEYMACGPMTSIMLNLMPGMYGSLGHTTTQGGQMAQMMDQLMAMSEATSAGTLDDMARQADAQTGSSITIAIPLIDYGFTGSFGNASISMNRANSDTHGSIYQAVGPRDSIPGPGSEFPLSGKVTILEYTPWVMRGTFSAGMVDLAEADMSRDDPELEVVHSISGSFNIIGPWRGDDRARVIKPENIQRNLSQDVGGFFEGSAADPSGTMGQSDPASTPATKGSGGYGCDCSCNFADSAPPQCVNQCTATFKACKGEPLAMITDDQMKEATTLDEHVEVYTRELRTRLEAHMRKTYAGNPKLDEIVSATLDTYDDVQNLEARITIVATSGMQVDCPAPKEVAERMKMAEFMFCQYYPEQNEKN